MACLPYKLFRNFRAPKGAREEHWNFVADYEPTADDVFVVSYPKCGTTWLQHIVYLLSTGGRPANSIKEVVGLVPFPEQDGTPEEPKILAYKTHLPFHLLKVVPQAKYLYVARNPKDACVSYYHFLKDLPGYQIESFATFFEAFLSGEVPYGEFFDHVLPWHAAAHLPHVLFLTYESLSTNREREIGRVARFLGHPPLQESTLKDIVRYSSFEFMKELASKDSFMKSYLHKSTGMEGDREVKKEPRMMRKGVVGDWRNQLTKEQSDRMDRHFANKIQGSGLAEEWSSEMGPLV